LKRGDRLDVASQRSARKQPHLDLAVALLFDDLREFLGAGTPVVVEVLHEGEPDGALLDVGCLTGAWPEKQE
jgi:hypothetical protein